METDDSSGSLEALSFRLLDPKAGEKTSSPRKNFYRVKIWSYGPPGEHKGTKVTVYKTGCVRGKHCPLDCMDTYTIMVYGGTMAPYIMLD